MTLNTIKKHKDFVTDADAPFVRSPFFLVRVRPAQFSDSPRYGLVVAKKTFKLAVDRNYAKRKMRDWVIKNEKGMNPKWDYIFIIRNAILKASRKDGRFAVRRALHRLDRMCSGKES